MLTPTIVGAAPSPAKLQNLSEVKAQINKTERVVVAYSKKQYPTRSSLPQVYKYNDGKYAGNLKITYVTSYRDGAGEWWGVTYEGTVYPIV
ncbi:PAS protein [Paenibacillus dendritiformis]|nr:PAS protein [Paenibacillus dendritiformis]